MSEAAADTLAAEENEWLQEMRWFLVVAAAVAAFGALQAEVNPPVGYWRDSGDGHSAGALAPAPATVLRDKHWVHYILFRYFNATTFVASLAIVMLLATKKHDGKAKVMALHFAAIVACASLIVSYFAGSGGSRIV